MIRTEPLGRHADERGVLVKAWPRPVTGEVYVVEIRPGQSRGHHLHRRGGEWFIPLEGRAILVVEDPATGERDQVVLDGVRARVEAGQAHALFADARAWVMAVADLPQGEDETVAFPVRPPEGR